MTLCTYSYIVIDTGIMIFKVKVLECDLYCLERCHGDVPLTVCVVWIAGIVAGGLYVASRSSEHTSAA